MVVAVVDETLVKADEAKLMLVLKIDTSVPELFFSLLDGNVEYQSFSGLSGPFNELNTNVFLLLLP